MSTNLELIKSIDPDKPFNQFRITARGIIIENEQILFVSDEGQYWYTPGGRLEPHESLETCVEREAFEETGLVVKAGPLLFVQECLDVKVNTHKIHFYFLTTIQEGAVSEHWLDAGGSVKYRNFFSYPEIKNNINIIPRFLSELEWNEEKTLLDNLTRHLHTSQLLYRGCILTRGFEMLDDNRQNTVHYSDSGNNNDSDSNGDSDNINRERKIEF